MELELELEPGVALELAGAELVLFYLLKQYAPEQSLSLKFPVEIGQK